MQVRQANIYDAESIVSLFCQSGSNPYNWTVEKWQHYYQNYPEGSSYSLVAVVDNLVVGHLGILPVKIGSKSAAFSLHAYVSIKFRGLSVISALMKEADKVCAYLESGLICGFANPNFSIVKEKIFKWKTLCWLGFKENITPKDIEDIHTKPFRFKYSTEWFKWRFGSLQNQYISLYVDPNGNRHRQLLKANNPMDINSFDGLEGWTPNFAFPTKMEINFSQPFSIKVYDNQLLDQGILDFRNWGIEMGDSDTFIYTPWN